MIHKLASIATCVSCLLTGAVAQAHVVAPAANNTTDAIGQNRIAGTGGELRQQILIGEAHLLPMIGKEIHAIELRRSASSETFVGGSVNMTVFLSASNTLPIECSSTFAANVGPNAVQVFSGPVTIPTSPGLAGSTVSWSTDNTVRIQLTGPSYYVYSGGPLCIDIEGTPVAGQEPGWWMADAADEGQSGNITDLGGGCGTYGTGTFRSTIAERTLVVGMTAEMAAYGTPGAPGFVMIGPSLNPGFPLYLVPGFQSAPIDCAIHLSDIPLLALRFFVPDPQLPVMGARADFDLYIPAMPNLLGFQMTTQWFDSAQTATSNAIEWTISQSMPTLDMALVEGHPQDSTGRARVNRAHVIRFEYE